MRPIHLVACVVLLSSPVAAQQRHTITHEDVFLSKRVGSPAISPDGRWVVFSVTEPSKGGESGMEWSRDSRRIAFRARREGDDASQIPCSSPSASGTSACR